MNTIFSLRKVLVALCLVLLASPVLAQDALMMATTTSTNDTGLLDYLAPIIKKDLGIDLKWVSVGTGKALEHGKNCDVDVLLVHAPKAEIEFVEAGHGVDRREVMYNDFVLVGPAADPAGVKGKPVAETLKAVAARQAVFVSRGDDSGTHKTEQGLWKKVDMAIPDKESWYVQAGQGMMQTLKIAEERGGYTLADRGTYIKYENAAKGKPGLVILNEGDKALLNQYGVIMVNPAKCPTVKKDLTLKLMDWLVSDAGQKAIAAFTMEGKPLFFPNAKK